MKNVLRFLVFLAVVMAAASIYGVLHLSERLDALESELIQEATQTPRVYIDGVAHDRSWVVTVGGEDYIAYDLALEAIDTTLTLSNSGQRVYVAPSEDLFDLGNAELNAFLTAHLVDINIPLAEIGGASYLPLEAFARAEGLVYGHTGDSLWIFTHAQVLSMMVEKGTPLYVNRNLNLRADNLEANGSLRGCSIGEGYFVASETALGYVRAQDVAVLEIEALGYAALESRAKVQVTEPFFLVWDQLNSYSESMDFDGVLEEPHADVIAPTVMALNINGIVINTASTGYMDWAHGEGLAVWALVSNSFNPDWTREVLSDPELMDRFIAQLVVYALIYDYDGINLDFENIYLEDSDKLTAFVGRMGRIMDLADLVFSMDVTVPGGSDQWSKVYDRAALGTRVDYLMLMAYDEYWASSEESGPVASIPWTREGLEAVLDMVESDHVVLGVPGYMRVWKEQGSNADSSVLSVKNRDAYLQDNGLEAGYLEEMGVNYAEKRINGTLYRVWLEDRVSMNQRLDLLDEFDLPGVALWRRGFLDKDLESLIGSRLE